MIDEMEDYDIKDEDGIEGSYTSAESAASSVISQMSAKDIYKVSAKIEEYSKEAVDNGWIDRTKATNDIKAAIDNETLVTQYDTFVKAQGYLKQIIDKLPDLQDKADTCKECFDKWEKDATENKGRGSDSIDSDCEEIEQLKNNTDPSLGPIRAGSDISGDDVLEFQNRLQSIYDLMDSYRKTLESIQYRGTTIFGTTVDSNVYTADAGIYKLDADFDSAAKGTKGNCTKPPVIAEGEGGIPVYQAELDTYIENTFDIYDEMAGMEGVSISNMPELHEYKEFGSIKGSSIQPTKFDEWLHEKFDLENRATSEVVKGLLSKFKELLKSLKDGFGADFIPYDNSDYVCSDNEINSVENTPSKLAKAGSNTNKDFDDSEDKDVTEQVDESTKVGGIFDCFNFGTLLQSGRDNLYALTYIMNMFTYETYHLEGMYQAARIPESDKTEKNIYYVCNPKEFTVKPGTAKDIYNDASMIGNSTSGWLNESPTYKYNKSLTNKMIGKTHNADDDANKVSWSYGNEVEYILYGGTNSANKAKVNTSIFFIRYALNLGPVMSMYYNDNVVKAIGTGVAGATMGVIPEPLVKAIICLGICAAESAVDLNYLLSGLPVVFFKDKDKNQLYIGLKISNGDQFAKDFVGGTEFKVEDIFSVNDVKIPESDTSFSYSDYLSLFLFIELCAVEDNVYYRMSDVIQANMTHNPDLDYKDKEEGFQMVDAKTYFQIKADTIKVKPMMLKLPYAQNFDSVKDVTNTDKWNTFSYKATRGY